MKGVGPQQFHKETLSRILFSHFSNVLHVLGHLRSINSHFGSPCLRVCEEPTNSLALSCMSCLGPNGDKTSHPDIVT